jgi:hypothetical protein
MKYHRNPVAALSYVPYRSVDIGALPPGVLPLVLDLDAGASYDPDNGVDGDTGGIASYSWSYSYVLAGSAVGPLPPPPEVLFADAVNNGTASIRAIRALLLNGTYIFCVTVTDIDGAQSVSPACVTVVIGTDDFIQLPSQTPTPSQTPSQTPSHTPTQTPVPAALGSTLFDGTNALTLQSDDTSVWSDPNNRYGISFSAPHATGYV